MKIKPNKKFAFLLALTMLLPGLGKESLAQAAEAEPTYMATSFSPPSLISKVSDFSGILTTPVPENVEVEKTAKGKIILKPKTTLTDQTLDKLQKSIKAEDSLIKPQLLYSSIAQREAREKEEFSDKDASDVTVAAADIRMKTGTPVFDQGKADTSTGNLGDDPAAPAGNSSKAYTPGYDSSESNDLVRSFDTITYLVSFSIQNNSLTEKYTSIGYQVSATLDNAVTMNGTTPQVNGNIVNGTMYTNPDGTQYSEGILQSSISGTGQVVVPIVIAVSSAPNGFKMTPTFSISLLNGKDETGQVVDFNQTYETGDGSNIGAGLVVPTTTISATPSAGVQLVKGQTVPGSTVFGSSSNNLTDADDIAAVVALAPMQGRLNSDYRGAAYPSGPITYTISQTGSYTPQGGSATAMTTSHYTPFTVNAYAPAAVNRATNWAKTGTVNENSYTTALPAPNANTEKIYMTPPTTDLSSVGVYHTGTTVGTSTSDIYATSSGTVTNQGYIGVYNPTLYNMTGNIAVSPITRAFASTELILAWDKTKTDSLARAIISSGANAGKTTWSQYKMNFSVDNITFEGKTVPNTMKNTLSYETVVSPAGGWNAVSFFAQRTKISVDTGNSAVASEPIAGASWEDTLNLSTGTKWDTNNYGHALLSAGQQIYLSTRQSVVNYSKKINSLTFIVMWDPSAFTYDRSRIPVCYAGWGDGRALLSAKLEYGIALNPSATSPVTMKLGTVPETNAQYKWYPSSAEAEAAGAISAARYTMVIDSNLNDAVVVSPPVTVNPSLANTAKTPGGYGYPAGNPLCFLSTYNMTAIDGTVIEPMATNSPMYTSQSIQKAVYKPTSWTDANTYTIPSGFTYWNGLGDSAYVLPYGITTETSVSQPVYDTNDKIALQVKAFPTGLSTVTYGDSITTTLPVGVNYDVGSTTDAKGDPLPDPKITTNSNGEQVLVWTFDQADLVNGQTINFEATPDISKLTFATTGLTSVLKVSTVGAIWVAGQTSGTDTSGTHESARTSQTQFQEQIIQSLVVSKDVDKTAIEVGNKATDTLNSGYDTALTYTLKVYNQLGNSISDIKLLDVLPYDGDTRGSVLHGGYTITALKSSNAAVKVDYTESLGNVTEKTDPNTISGWKSWTLGSAVPANAKGILLTIPSLAVGEETTLTVTIQPDNQQVAGDVFSNNATLNSSMDKQIYAQIVRTSVYGRDLSGMAWLDKDKNGIYDAGREPTAAQVPVKLYRQSRTASGNGGEVQLLSDLRGNSLVDGSGHSTVLTDEQGRFKFDNLPEGDYVAEFEIAGVIEKQYYSVTQEQVGTNAELNSKVNPTTYRTSAYAVGAPEILPTASQQDAAF